MKTAFKIGDCVSWESQSSGYSTKKVGTVVAVVRGCGKDAITDRLDRFIPKELRETTKILFDGWQRPEDCYIIVVRPKSGKGKSRLYCPQVSALRGSRL